MVTTLLTKLSARFSGLFARRVPLFRKKDRAAWERFKAVLAEEGILEVKSYSYNADLLFANGCGAKLDPRNFGEKGRIDRDVYVIEVREDQREAALAALSRRGLTPEVEERPTMDAAERLREQDRERLKYFSRQPPRG